MAECIHQDLERNDLSESSVATKSNAINAIGGEIKLSGAARKRLKFFLSKGYNIEDARILAVEPIAKGERYQSARKRSRSANTSLRNNPRKRRTMKTECRTLYTVASPVEITAPLETPIAPTEVTQNPSFGEPVACVKLGITPTDFPQTVWSTEQLKAVQHSILNEVRKQKNGPVKPQFTGCAFRSGWLNLTCMDSCTAEWVKTHVPKLKPWRTADMKVVQEADVPRPQIYIGYFAELDSTRTSDILELLEGQNDGLRIRDWRVLRRAYKGSVVELVLAIDPISARVLKDRQHKVSYGFGTMTIKPKVKVPSVPDPPIYSIEIDSN